MTLPKQAQRLADEARRLQDQVVNPEAPPVEASAEPDTETVDEGQVEAVEVEPNPAPAGAPELWEERYHHLEGKYNAEVPRQQAQIRALTEQLASVQELLGTLHQTPQPAQPVSTYEGATPAEIEKFGADLIDLIERVCNARIAAARMHFQQELDGVRGEVGQVTQQQARSAEQVFYDYLDEHVPDWQTLNRDARFLEWLALPAPFTRVPKQQLLADAAKSFDGPGAVSFFLAFKQEVAPQPPAPRDTRPRNELERQVQPGKRGVASGNAPIPTTPTFSRAEVSQFYTDIARGLWASRPQEKAQREAEIFAAQRGGRIV